MDGPGLASIAAGIDFQIPSFDAQAWLQLTILIVSLILCALASAAETVLYLDQPHQTQKSGGRRRCKGY